MEYDSTVGDSPFAKYEPRRPERSANATTAFEVRPATPADQTQVAEIIRARDGGTPARIIENLRRQLDEGPQRWHMVVAVVEDRVVSWGRSTYFVPPAGSPTNVAPEGWHLAGLIVSPTHRRRGIGLALTRYRLDWLAERAGTAWYFANAQNRVTIELHEKLGFVEVTRDFSFPRVSFSGEGVGILFRLDMTHAHGTEQVSS